MKENLWDYMKEFNFPLKLVNIIRLIIANMEYLVKGGRAQSEHFDTSVDLKPMDVIAPLLFNIVIKSAG